MPLTTSQKDVLSAMVYGIPTFLTGGPGTGKTFLLKELCKLEKKWEEKLHRGGMLLLIFFIILISANDIWKLFN